MTKEEVIKQLTILTETKPIIENNIEVFHLSGDELTIMIRETHISVAIDRDFSGFYTDFSIYNYDSIKGFAIDIDTDEDDWTKFYLVIYTISGARYILI